MKRVFHTISSIAKKAFAVVFLLNFVFSPTLNDILLSSNLSAPLAASVAEAAFNQQINYQGKLTDTSNVSVNNGSYNIEFKLYTVNSGGTAVWTETWCKGTSCSGTGTDNRVTVSNGLFSVMLGSTTSLASVDFNQPLYLGVNIGGSASTPTWDGEMAPRKILGAVPAAFEATKLNGLNSSQFLRTDANNSTSTASTFITLTQSGAGRILDLVGTGSTNVFTALSSGNVGIGTTSPWRTLSVNGSSDLGTNALAGYFTATTSTASVFPYASTTAISASGTGFFGNLLATASSTFQNFTFLNATGTNATTTNFFATTASSTNLYSSNLAVGGTVLTTSGGNVGIGTASPGAKLEIKSANIQVLFGEWAGNNNYAGIGLAGSLATGDYNFLSSAGDTHLYINRPTGHDIYFRENNSTGVTFASGGNVGIGETAPGSKLSVSGGGTFGASYDTTAAPTNGLLVEGNVGIGTTTPGQKLSVAGDILGNNIIGSYFTATSSSATSTLAGGLSVAGTSGLTVLQNGNVGVGTAGPSLGKLQVSATAAKPGIFIETATENDTIIFQSGHTEPYSWKLMQDEAVTGDLYLKGRTNSVDLSVMYFKRSNGNVGIGTTSPGQKLSVAGDILGNNIIGSYFTATSSSATSTFAGGLAIETSGFVYDYSTNNVGIGTASPTAKLQLVTSSDTNPTNIGTTNFDGRHLAIGSTGANASALAFSKNTTTGGSAFISAATIGQSWDPIGFQAGSYNWYLPSVSSSIAMMVMDSTGNVGIGTTSPGQKLSVAGDILGNNIIGSYFTATSSTASAFQNLTFTNATGTNATTTNFFATTASSTNLYSSNLAVGGTVLTTSGGNVGIGTASPGQKLSVNGAIKFGSIAEITLTADSSWGGQPTLRMYRSDGTSMNNSVVIGDTASHNIAMYVAGASASILYLNGDSPNTGILFGAAGTSAGSQDTGIMRNAAGLIEINNGTAGTYRDLQLRAINPTSGNLGIGTTSPGQKLSVAGDILGNNIIGSYFTATSSTASSLVGSLGIGSTSPSTTLGVVGSGYFTTGLGVGKLNTTANTVDVALGTNSVPGAYAINGTNVLMASTTLFSYYALGAGNASTINTTNTGDLNVGIGYQSLLANTTGQYNTATGYQSLKANLGGSRNSGYGLQTLLSNTSGNRNSAFGAFNLYSNTTGSQNSALGGEVALFSNTTGSENIAIGYRSMYNSISGNNNLAIGNDALFNSTASNNIAIGYHAGDALTTGSTNIVIGYDVDAPAVTSSNTLNIGNLLFGTSIDGTGTTLSSGNIGIGTTSPGQKLSVAGDILGNNIIGSYFTATSSSATSTLAGGLAIETSGLVYDYSTNNVGIGTASPSSKLQVMGVITTDNTNYGEPSNAGTTDSAGDKLVVWEAASYRSALGMRSSGMYIQNTGGGVAYDGISFYTGASTASEIMRIQRDGSVAVGNGYVATAGPSNGMIIQGNVGIGTASPTYKIDVTGTGHITGDVTLDSRLMMPGAAATLPANSIGLQDGAGIYSKYNGGSSPLLIAGYVSNVLQIGESGYAINSPGSSFTLTGNYISGAGNVNDAAYGMGAGNDGMYLPTTNEIGFTTQNVEKVRIASAGNVGIGTTSPGQKLSVAGDILGNNIIGSYFTATSTTASSLVGSLGIGSTSPSTTLGVVGSAYITTGLGVGKLNTTANTVDVAVGTNSIAGAYRINGANMLLASTTLGSYYGLGAGDIATINTTNVGTNNTAVGPGALSANTTGVFNNAFGQAALGSNLTGIDNTAIGAQAMYQSTSTSYNTAIGFAAMGGYAVGYRSGGKNVALGANALYANTTGTDNIAIGGSVGGGGGTLAQNTSGTGNIAIGFQSFQGNTTASANTGLGYRSGEQTTSATGGNTFLGYFAGFSNISGSNNSLVGTGADVLSTDLSAASAFGTYAYVGCSNCLVLGGTGATYKVNVGIGTTTPYAKLSVQGETAADATFALIPKGSQTGNILDIYSNAATPVLNSVITAGGNWGIGTTSPATTLSVAGSGYFTGGIGAGVLNTTTGLIKASVAYDVLPSTAAGTYRINGTDIASASTTMVNYFFGTNPSTLQTTMTGSYNTGVGRQTLYVNTGSQNSAFGDATLSANTTGGTNSGFGYRALLSNTTGSVNSAFGYAAMSANVDGGNNAAFGGEALSGNTSGGSNVAVGWRAMSNNTTGSTNTAVGLAALGGSVTGTNNVAIGENASGRNGSATSSVAIGTRAYYGASGMSAQGYTAVGYYAGGNGSLATGADYNTLLGYESGFNLTTGSNNVFLGPDTTGNGGSNPITTGSQNVLVGYNVGVPSATANGQLSIANIIYGTGNTGTGQTLSTGKIGIGTSTPERKLVIYDSANVTTFTGDQVNGVRISGAENTSGGYYSLLGFGANTSQKNLAQIGAKISGTGSQLEFGTSNSYATGITNTAMVIDNTGNVGIGTTTPTYPLTVNGVARFNSNQDASDYFYTAGISSDGRMGLFGVNDGGTARQILAARSGNDCLVFGSDTTALGEPGCGGLEGAIAQSQGTLALRGVTIGGLPGAGTHKSLEIGTPYSAAYSATSSMNMIDIDTDSWVANANAGGRPGIHFAALSYAFGVDNGLGYSGGSGDTYSTRALTIASSTEVGVGTSTPWGKLSVTNTGTNPSFIVEDSTSPDSTPFIVDASGNVGIGTAAPGNKLEIVGAAVSLYQNNTANTSMVSTQIQNVGGNFYSGLESSTGGSLFTGGLAYAGAIGTANATALQFATNNNVRMTIDSSGNVGIGTTSPATTLSVAGSGYFTGGIGVGKVNTTANTMDVANTGAYKFNGSNVLIASTTLSNYYFAGAGPSTLNTTATGPNNLGIGPSAIANIAGGSTQNIAIGSASQVANVAGNYNTSLGVSSLYLNGYGDGNVAVGNLALYQASSSNNVGVGFYVMAGAVTTGSGNVGVGSGTLTNNTSGSRNVAVGGDGTSAAALGANTTGANNVGIGYSAGITNTTGSNNVFVGVSSNAGSAALNNATALGFSATVGCSNCLVLGQTNVSVGIGTTTPYAKLSVAGSATDAITFALKPTGSQTANILDIYSNDATPVLNSVITAGGNWGIGSTTPATTLSVGGSAYITTGLGVGKVNTTANTVDVASGGSYKINGSVMVVASTTKTNYFFGHNQTTLFTTMTGTNNVGVGDGTHALLTTGSNNSAFGINALNINTTGSNNIAIGNSALLNTTVSSNNTVVGKSAVQTGDAASDNTALGTSALQNAGSASQNTAIGSEALAGQVGAASVRNTAVGYRAGKNTTSAFDNVIIGSSAGSNVDTGYYNTIMGSGAGNVLTSGLGNTLLGFQVGNALTIGSYNIALGYDIDLPSNTASNQLNIGNLIFSKGIDGTGTTLSSGNVGVGTTSPGQKLSVAGDILGNNIIGSYFTSTTTTASTFAGPVSMSSGADYARFFQDSGTPTLEFFDSGVGTSKITSAGVNSSWNVTGTLTATGAGLVSNPVGGSGANLGVGTLNLWSASGGAPFIAFAENAVANRGTLGFAANSADLTYRSTGASMTTGTELFRIASTGNVGIGTTSPGQKLSVAGDILGNNIIGSYFTATSTTASSLVGSLGIGSTSPSTTLGVVGSGYFTGGIGVGSVNTSAGTLVATGNITTSGDYMMGGGTYNVMHMSGSSLQLGTGNVGSISTPSNLIITGTITGTNSTGYTSLMGAQSDAGTFNTGVLNLAGGTNTDRQIQFGIGASTNNNWIQSWNNGSVVGSLNLQINGGNVGIGTTSPGQKLSVAGDILGNNIIGSYFTATTTTASTFAGALTSSGTVTGTNLVASSASATSTLAGGLAIETSGFVYDYSTNNVGIGTASPGAKLDVSGTIRSTHSGGYAVDVSGTAGVGTILSWVPGSGYAALKISATSLNFWSGGSLQYNPMTIDSTGNIGVGSTTPWGTLSITNTGTVPSFVVEDTTSPDSTPFIVDASGNVGVGTASPNAKLDVVGGTLRLDASQKIFWSTAGAAYNNDASIYSGGGNGAVNVYAYTGSGIQIVDNSGNGALLSMSQLSLPATGTIDFGGGGSGITGVGAAGHAMKLSSYGNSADGYWDFYDSGASASRVRIIANTGLVGIGTTTPVSLLNVAGATAPKITLSDTDASTDQKHWFLESDTGVFSIGTTSDALSVSGSRPLTIASTGFGTTTLRGLTINGQATSTSNVGINLTAGCFAIGGTCVGGSGSGTVTSIATTYPLQGGTITTTGTLSLAFGTTTSNTWAGLQTFANASTTNVGSTGSAYFATSAGSVGIGTTSPWAQLSVNPNGISGPSFAIGSSTKTDFVVTNGGNVGIGTASPLSALHVKGSSASATIQDSVGNVTSLLLRNATPTTLLNISTDSGANASIAANGQLTLQAGASNPLVFQTNGATTKMAIDLNGVVSLYNTSGVLTSVLNTHTAGNWAISTTTPNNKLDIYDTSKAAIGFSGASGSTYKWTIGMDVSNGGRFSIASSTALGTTDRFVIDGNGNVGIATTSPGWKFSVASSTSYTVGAATGAGVSEINVGTGNYTASSYQHDVRIYAYRIVNSRRVYSATYATATYTDNGDAHAYDLRWTWSAPAGGADGYRLLKSDTVNGYTYNYYADDTASPFDENAGAASWTLGNTVLPSALFDDIAMVGKGNLLVEGATAIGTTSPWAKLSVNGSVAFQNLSLSTGTPDAVCIDPTTFEITVNTGAQTCSVSSKRFKHNIESLQSGLALVNKLRPVSFELNSNNQPRIGFIAEEVVKVEPRLVFTEANGKSPRGVRYEDMTALLAKAIQEQQVQIDLLLKIASTTASSTVSGTLNGSVSTSTVSVAAVVDQVLSTLRSASEWVVTKISATLGVFDRVETNTAAVKNGIEFKDSVTGDTYCVTIANGEWDKRLGTCAAATTPAASTAPAATETSGDTVAPVITINGNNPAEVQKGASYLDLGASVTDNVDNNIGITVTGEQIDTSVVGSYTVTYSAVDQAGNKTEATRTVEVTGVSEPAPEPAPAPAPTEPAPVEQPASEPAPAPAN